MAKIVLQSTAPQEVWQEIMNVEQQMKWEQLAVNVLSKLTVSRFFINFIEKHWMINFLKFNVSIVRYHKN